MIYIVFSVILLVLGGLSYIRLLNPDQKWSRKIIISLFIIYILSSVGLFILKILNDISASEKLKGLGRTASGQFKIGNNTLGDPIYFQEKMKKAYENFLKNDLKKSYKLTEEAENIADNDHNIAITRHLRAEIRMREGLFKDALNILNQIQESWVDKINKITYFSDRYVCNTKLNNLQDASEDAQKVRMLQEQAKNKK